MAFPLIPLLLLGGVGAAAVFLTRRSSASTEPVIKDGVKYGPGCSTLEIVDMATFMQRTEPRAKSLNGKINPDTPAKEAISKIAKTLFPGPGCTWSTTDFTVNTTFLLPGGEPDGTWKDLMFACGDMPLGQALTSGMFEKFMGGFGSLQGSGAPSALGTLLASAAKRGAA